MTIDLSSLGWDDAFAADFERLASRPRGPNELRPARVSRVDRGFCTALAADGPVRASFSGGLLTGAAADPARMPCAGDWVIVRAWPDERLTVEVVMPRRTAIIRAAAGVEPRAQVLAANLDTVAVVEPMDPSPDLARIERLLTLAYQSGARPVVVLTKADLAADPLAVAEQVAAASAGAEVFAASARTGEGLSPLKPFIGYGKTLGLLGPSGAGKSSLVNALAGATVMGTKALRADGRGRHTTTHRALIPLPDGGAVLDTPGIRLVGLFESAAGLERAFADVALLAAGCRFRDCRHDREPGCAVRAAVDEGDLSARRLASWKKLHKEQSLERARKIVIRRG
jgi:ribosome biogenesis GTPase / thiamine phosphate phosphatase